MRIEELREFFNKQKWTYAKTYADRAPHEYIVRHKHVREDEEFMEDCEECLSEEELDKKLKELDI